MEDFLKAVANMGFPIAVTNVGFPIAVAAYLPIKIEGRLDSLSSSINQLSTILPIKLNANDGRDWQQRRSSGGHNPF